MTIDDITSPSIEPISLAEGKSYLRVDHTQDDDLISKLILSARHRVECHIRASLIERLRTYTTRTFSESGCFINHAPISAIEAVRVIDVHGEITPVSLSDIHIDLRARPVFLSLARPTRWTQICSHPRYIEVDVRAGYGPDETDVPMPIRQAILLLLAQAYEYRDTSDTPPFPLMAEAVLMPYRSLNL